MVIKKFSASKRYLHMMIICIGLLMASVVDPHPVIGGSVATIDCDATLEAWRYDPNLRDYARGCTCPYKHERPVCRQSGGGSYGGSSGGSSYKGLSSKNKMKLQMLQGVMDDFTNKFIKWLNAPPSTPKGPTPEQIAAQREQFEREKEAWRLKVQQQINEMQSEYDKQQKKEADTIKKKVLAGLKGVDRDPGEKSFAFQQLRCSTFWNLKAAKARIEGNEKEVMMYSRFAGKPDNASMAECSKAVPEPPMPSSGDEFRRDLFETVNEEVNLRLPMIEQARGNQREAASRVSEKQQKVDDLKNKHTADLSEEEKRADDELLSAAMQELDAATALKNEADKGVAKLNLEIDALSELANITSGAQNTSAKGQLQ